MALTSLPLVLLTVLVSLVIWQLTESKPLPTGRRLTVHQALQNIPNSDIDKQLAELLPEDMFTGRDPFFRSAAPQPPTPNTTNTLETATGLQEVHLTTIAQGTSGRYCLINDSIYSQGSGGNGFIVQKIEPGYVVFSTSSQTFTLKPGQKITLENGKILSPIDEK